MGSAQLFLRCPAASEFIMNNIFPEMVHFLIAFGVYLHSTQGLNISDHFNTKDSLKGNC